jgi:pimeloyl-ACP methyl ester carboxylesterase
VSQLTAPNQSIEAANGVSYAYRRFGSTAGAVPPLVFLQHFRGNLDNWDPALVDAVAEHREVILFDNAGVGGSTGTVPGTVAEMARDALAFLDALGLARVDVLGFSLGGFVAQELAVLRPQVVRRIVLAGTGPQGGEGMQGLTDDIAPHAVRDEPGAEDLLALFFERTQTSIAKGWEFIQRIFTRTEDRDADTTPDTRDAQLRAIAAWGVPDPGRAQRLAAITHPVFAANGDNDRMIPTVNTHLLGEQLTNAQVKIYPDAGHGFLFQYPAEFAADVQTFLAA